MNADELPAWDSDESRNATPVEGIHFWIRFGNLPSCRWCMRVRNASSDDRPCPGPRGKIALR